MKFDSGFLNLVDLYRNFLILLILLYTLRCNSPERDYLFSQISMNVPYLTSVIATPRVTIPTGHTSAPVTAATPEMDAPVKVPSDLDLLAQFLRDSNKNKWHLQVVGSNANGSNIIVLNDFV